MPFDAQSQNSNKIKYFLDKGFQNRVLERDHSIQTFVNEICLLLLVTSRYQVERELVIFTARADKKDEEIGSEQYRKNVDQLRTRGFSYSNLGKYDIAIRDYNGAIELKPPSHLLAEAYCSMGYAYHKLGKYEKAVQDYNSYLRINGDKDGKAEQVRKWIKDLGYTTQY